MPSTKKNAEKPRKAKSDSDAKLSNEDKVHIQSHIKSVVELLSKKRDWDPKDAYTLTDFRNYIVSWKGTHSGIGFASAC